MTERTSTDRLSLTDQVDALALALRVNYPLHDAAIFAPCNQARCERTARANFACPDCVTSALAALVGRDPADAYHRAVAELAVALGILRKRAGDIERERLRLSANQER